MSEELLYLNFNQDKSHLCAGSTSGFCIYKAAPLELIHRQGTYYADHGSFRVVEMHENTQLLALVGASEDPAFNPRRLTMWNIDKRISICETSFSEPVLKVSFNSLRIVAVTSGCIYIYDINTLRGQHSIRTLHNPKGLSALTPGKSSCLLLYPASNEIGLVCIYDCFTMQSLGEIDAHRSPLAALSVSFEGKLAATASSKGTIIRVFSLPSGHKLHSFKRGISYVDVWDLSFIDQYALLMLCSSSGTIHIFQIAGESRTNPQWGAFIQKKLRTTISYVLPETYTESVDSSRSFIKVRTHSDVCFKAAMIENSKVLAVSMSGRFQIFDIDLLVGGDGRLVQEGYLSRLRQSLVRES